MLDPPVQGQGLCAGLATTHRFYCHVIALCALCGIRAFRLLSQSSIVSCVVLLSPGLGGRGKVDVLGILVYWFMLCTMYIGRVLVYVSLCWCALCALSSGCWRPIASLLPPDWYSRRGLGESGGVATASKYVLSFSEEQRTHTQGADLP